MLKIKTSFVYSLLIVLFFMITFGISPLKAQEQSDIKKSDKSLRIVGGYEATPGAWPWIGVVFYAGTKSFFCGSALVGSKWVVTAAHCVDGRTPSSIEIGLGIHDLCADEGERHSIKQIYIHPDYNSQTGDSDIALLEMDEETTYEPITLVEADMNIDSFMATVIGWGDTTDGENCFPQALQQVEIPIVSNTECNTSYTSQGLYYNPISENMVCAGYAEGGKDACQGDSGGPLMIYDDNTWKLAGVVSWGEGCAAPYYYGVYTRISKFRTFIDTYVPEKATSGSMLVYIPHITGGASDWNDYLQADSLSADATSFTLTLYGSSGEALYSQSHSLGVYGKMTLDLKSLAGSAQSGVIYFYDPKLSFRLTQENNRGGGVAEFRLTDDLYDSIRFYFSDVISTIGWKGLALTNFHATAATVRLTVSGSGGISGTLDTTIGPKQKIVGLYTDWFPTIAFEQAQVITATVMEPSGTSMLSGIAISGDLNNALLLFTSGSSFD